MRRLRVVAAVAAVAASTLTLTTPPASAAVTAFAFQGTMEIGCFGCGVYGPTGNSASYTAAGALNGPLGAGVGQFTFRVTSPPGPLCSASWTMEGSMSVGGSVSPFTIVFTGPMGDMTAPGLPASGRVVAVFTSPAGIPCGAPAVVRFSGELVGL